MKGHASDSLLDRLIAEAQADDYALAPASASQVHRMGWKAALVTAIIAALLVSAFVRSRDVQPVAEQRRQELISRIEQATDRVDESQTQAAELRASVSQLQQLATSGLSDDFAGQLRAVEVASGFVGLSGPGAIVTLRDGQQPLPRGVSAEEARVLDIDMQMVVNGLWEAGAQAIAINGIRLTSATAIRTAGQAILVDFRPLEPPYTIEAIGPENLAAAFDRTSAATELEQLTNDYGIQSEVDSAKELKVPASTANLPTKAQVVKGGEQ